MILVAQHVTGTLPSTRHFFKCPFDRITKHGHAHLAWFGHLLTAALLFTQFLAATLACFRDTFVEIREKKRKNVWLKAWDYSSTFATIPIVPALPRTGKKNRLDSPGTKKKRMQTDSEQTPNSGCASLHCQDQFNSRMSSAHSRLSSNSNFDNELYQVTLETDFRHFLSKKFNEAWEISVLFFLFL